MLILGRSEGQSVYVNGPCLITVCETRGNECRLGFEADKSVSIIRMEAKTHEAKDSARREVVR